MHCFLSSTHCRCWTAHFRLIKLDRVSLWVSQCWMFQFAEMRLTRGELKSFFKLFPGHLMTLRGNHKLRKNRKSSFELLTVNNSCKSSNFYHSVFNKKFNVTEFLNDICTLQKSCNIVSSNKALFLAFRKWLDAPGKASPESKLQFKLSDKLF